MSLFTAKAASISREEFARFFQKCVPPTGWSKVLGAYIPAIGFSGGPDSTCLQFLIDRYLKALHETHPLSRPLAAVSLTINHGLQASSDDMAEHCSKQAAAMKIPHLTSSIPWGEPPFPQRPETGESYEGIARKARYHLMFQAMSKAGARVLAVGHQGDDQVETSLMRISRGSSEIGAGGMRKCRRWGMGADTLEGSLGWGGMEGMNRWIVRPLLEVSKDRILATCDENNLEYIMDSSNFQPELTLRNAIRHLLSKNTLDPQAIGLELPPHIAESLSTVHQGIASLESVEMDPSAGLDQLRSAVTVLSEQVEDIDTLVDSCLNRCHVPSPPSTYLVSYRGLASIRDPLVRRGVVLRIMRYVSFHAWGTLRADGERRKSSLDRIIENLWAPDPFVAGLKPFVAGGGVHWTPVIIGEKGVKIPRGQEPKLLPGEFTGWLAARQPPLPLHQHIRRGTTSPLVVDITDKLRAGLEAKLDDPEQKSVEILWDCRFALRFDLDKIPDSVVQCLDEGGHIHVQPYSKWYWPKIILSPPGGLIKNRKGGFVSDASRETILHSSISMATHTSPAKLDRDIIGSWSPESLKSWSTHPTAVVTSDWIELEWIRTIAGT
ncbi:PP-loop family-domain-containing protein [Mycena polygramma]|nr:PP-loop family-domain-containing protein [Mycena polygramma]